MPGGGAYLLTVFGCGTLGELGRDILVWGIDAFELVLLIPFGGGGATGGPTEGLFEFPFGVVTPGVEG